MMRLVLSSRRGLRTAGLVAGLSAALLPACAEAPGPSRELLVVASNSILGDVVSRVVGQDGRVEVLVPRGADPHEFQASARQIAGLHRAHLVVLNGLGLEDGLRNALRDVRGAGVPVLEVGPELDPRPIGDRPGAAVDPHVWLDPRRMARAAEIVGARLESLTGRPVFGARGRAESQALRALDADVERVLRAVPPARRKLVSHHDVLGYFARRYGYDVVGTVVPGGSTLSAADAASLGRLAGVVRRLALPAVFSDRSDRDDLDRALAREAGGGVRVVPLSTESLGPRGSDTTTYRRLLLSDARAIAGALR